MNPAQKVRRSPEGGYARGDETRQRIIEAAIQLFGSHQLAITAEGLSHHVPFALVPTVRIPAANLRAVAVVPTQLGGELHVRSKSRRARTRITRATDRVALRYAAQLIAAKLALPLED